MGYIGNHLYGYGPEGGRDETTPVGSFPANGFGLSDMHGNVWEWCLDSSHGSYQGAPIDGRAWSAAPDAPFPMRILRGGSLYSDAGNCRSANRASDSPDFESNLIGFRVACSPPWP